MLHHSVSEKYDPSESELRQVVEELKSIHQRSGVSAVAAVGKLVLDRFFGGSVTAWQSGHRNKERSLRRLARCEGCPYGKSALHQAIRIHLVRLINPSVQTYEHIGPSHIVVTLALNDAERAELLRAAEENRWSVRRLRDEVERVQTDVNVSQRIRRGRPRQAQTERAVVAVRQAKKQVELALLATRERDVVPLELPELQRLLKSLEEVCLRLVTLQASPEIPPSFNSFVEVVPPSRRTRLAKTAQVSTDSRCVGLG